MEKARYFSQKIDFSDNSQLELLFKHYSDDSLSLNIESFHRLLTDLVSDEEGEFYGLSELIVNELFCIFDKDKDGIINSHDFVNFCKDFIKPLVNPVSALLVIDVQNDFINGSLALKNCPAKEDGNDIIKVTNDLLEKHKFDVIAYSKDYHPENHISFLKNVHMRKLSGNNKKPVEETKELDKVKFEGPPEMDQVLWPTHCVQGSWGSELHKDLCISEDSLFIHKGTNPEVDSYSAFFDNMKLSKTVLDEELKKKHVTHVFICGLAFDYCVSYTAIDAAELGYATVVIQDATRGTDKNNIRDMKEKLKSANCVLAESNEIENILLGNDIRAEFASTIFTQLKRNMTE